MDITKTDIEGLVVIEPKIFGDNRGYFYESFRKDILQQAVGYDIEFVQDNQSQSAKGVLRGLHFQLSPFSQAKLVRVVVGEILDVAVDIRKDSPTFGKYFAIKLSAENHKQLFIPKGFAHGFYTLSQSAVLQYRCDEYYNPKAECGIAWNDPTIGIAWPIKDTQPILSQKDATYTSLLQIKELL